MKLKHNPCQPSSYTVKCILYTTNTKHHGNQIVVFSGWNVRLDVESHCSSFSLRGFGSEMAFQITLQLNVAQFWPLTLAHSFRFLKVFDYAHMDIQLRHPLFFSLGKKYYSVKDKLSLPALAVQFYTSNPHSAPMLLAITHCHSWAQSLVFPAFELIQSRKSHLVRSSCYFSKHWC